MAEFTWQGAWNEILEEIHTYTGEPAVILFIALAAAVYLMIMNRDVRTKILVPLLILIPVVINPPLYHYVYRDLRYWRFFWLLPQSCLIAMALNDLCRRFRQPWLKCLCLAVTAAGIVLVGTNVYLREDKYSPTANPYKILQRTIDISDIILADDPHPRVVFDNKVCFETREYSGEIIQPWGRHGMTDSAEARAFYYEMISQTPKDREALFAYAEQNGYTYVSCRKHQEEKAKELKKTAKAHGYELLDTWEKYFIFRKKPAV